MNKTLVGGMESWGFICRDEYPNTCTHVCGSAGFSEAKAAY